VPDVIEAVLRAYVEQRTDAGPRRESFIETVRRIGLDPFKTAANTARSPMEVSA
jgi:sulfite reductase (NADPH) hemoprotein beta-component